MEEHHQNSFILPNVCDASIQCNDVVDQEICGSVRYPRERSGISESSNIASAEINSDIYRKNWKVCDTLSSISSLEQQDTLYDDNAFGNMQYRDPEGASNSSDSSVQLDNDSEEEKTAEGHKCINELVDSDNKSKVFSADATLISVDKSEDAASSLEMASTDLTSEVEKINYLNMFSALTTDTSALDETIVSDTNVRNKHFTFDKNKSDLEGDAERETTSRRNTGVSTSGLSTLLVSRSKSTDLLADVTKLLNVYYTQDSDEISLSSAENAVMLLEECLQYFHQKVAALSITVKQLEKEVDDIRGSAMRREKNLIREHKERLSRMAKDHEDELRAAIERAVNARQQSSSLQEQLDSVQAKLEVTEKEAVLETRNTLKSYTEQLEKWGKEKHSLLKKITELENLLKDKSKEVSTLQSVNESLRKQTTVDTRSEDYMEHLEKELAKERARFSTLHSELQQEREHNRYLWAETRKRSQQMASLQSRLEALCSDVSHRDRLLAILKEEILSKIMAHTEQEKKTLQSLDLVNDNTLNEKWSELVSESLISKDAKVQQLKKELNEKELLLVKSTAKLKELSESLKSTSLEIKKTEAEVNQRKRELSTKKLDLYELELNLSRTMNLISDRSTKLEDANSSLKQGVGYTSALSTPSISLKQMTPQSETGVKKYKDRILEVEREAKYFLQQCKNRDKQIALLQQDLQTKDEKIMELTQLLEIERGNINYISGPDVVCFPKSSEESKTSITKGRNEPTTTPSRLSSKLSGRGSPLGAEGSVGKQKSRKKPTQSYRKTKETSSGNDIKSAANSSSDDESMASSSASVQTSSKSISSDATTDSNFQGFQTKKRAEISLPICPRHASRLGEDRIASLSSYLSSTSTTPIRGELERALFRDKNASDSSKTDNSIPKKTHRRKEHIYHSTPNDVDVLKRSERKHHIRRDNSSSSAAVQTD